MQVERLDDNIYVRAEHEMWVRPIEARGNLRELRQWITGIAGDSISSEAIADFLRPMSLDIATRAATVVGSAPRSGPSYSEVVTDSAEGLPAQG